MYSKAYRLMAALLGVMVLSGCVSLGGSGSAAPEQYYLLTAKASIQEPRTRLSLGVGPVRVAPFLDRTGVVAHNTQGEVEFSLTHRWAEPLVDGIQRVLVQNLEALSGARVSSFPWSRATAPDLALRLDVLDLNRRPDGVAILEVNWVLENRRDDTLIEARRDGFMIPTDGNPDDYAALVSAYSELLVQLAGRVAGELPAD